MKLKNKKALVTGGGGGIGSAVAMALANAGADVALSYVEGVEQDYESAARVKKEIEGLGRKAILVSLDQRCNDSIQACVATVTNQFEGLDILVNNGAWNIGIPFQDLDSLTIDIWDRMLETNLRGPFLLSKAFAKHLSAHGCGRIVNIASVGGMLPVGSSMAYSCSKAGLIHLSRCMAVALAPDVAVNCIAPGLVEGTRLASNLPSAVGEAVKSQTVLGRTASAEDIGEQTVMFCQSVSMTGQLIAVDGGMPGAMR